MFGFKKTNEYVIQIEGMRCMHCAKKVEDTLKAIKGVKAVSVDLENKNAKVSANVKDVDAFKETVKSSIKEAGFEVLNIL